MYGRRKTVFESDDGSLQWRNYWAEHAKRPPLNFVLESLHQALPVIQEQATYLTLIHSEQGGHYQHRYWMKTLKQKRIFQSMSLKATCADNAAMKNFFGLFKQEMYDGEASSRMKN
ncbi:hypothetical protein [Planococcus shixiaomingii]|uniref:hypothetical protein n=1 Tax=Planococcus shixiaomingii TaxID=3058393 RepID=UPI0026232123|nr:hypothetical protein [Planococcus sp. N022]WKA53990.1 hypothetical protein QWY21_15155 [Planococcus sp. N022]